MTAAAIGSGAAGGTFLGSADGSSETRCFRASHDSQHVITVFECFEVISQIGYQKSVNALNVW